MTPCSNQRCGAAGRPAKEPATFSHRRPVLAGRTQSVRCPLDGGGTPERRGSRGTTQHWHGPSAHFDGGGVDGHAWRGSRTVHLTLGERGSLWSPSRYQARPAVILFRPRSSRRGTILSVPNRGSFGTHFDVGHRSLAVAGLFWPVAYGQLSAGRHNAPRVQPAVILSSARPTVRLANPDTSEKDWGTPRSRHGSRGDRGYDLTASAGSNPAALTTSPTKGPQRRQYRNNSEWTTFHASREGDGKCRADYRRTPRVPAQAGGKSPAKLHQGVSTHPISAPLRGTGTPAAWPDQRESKSPATAGTTHRRP